MTAAYSLGLHENFRARHLFPEKEGKDESLPHPHDYRMEVQFHGKELDGSGYLVDLEEIEVILKELLTRYTDVLLNGLPEFSGSPPSLEHFARILCHTISERVKRPQIEAVTVKLWESERAWASFHKERR